jgi:2-methylisocitrate lyase-like PEP mutase family enzyme
MKKTTRLRQLIEREEIVVIPGAYDPFLARCVEQAGFEAVYMTGAGVSHSVLGMPDLGLLTFSEMVERAARIADVTEIPLLADADTGYGNAINVIRTVKGYERAGVAGLHIEDQVLPKKCGHFDQKAVIPLDEMLGKLKAALDARQDPDFLIVARTDARTAVSLEEAIARAQAFAETGVDVVFVESPTSREEMARICRAVKTPLLANMVETGLTPILPAADLQALGYGAAIYPGALGRFIAKQVAEFLRVFRAEGTTLSQMDRMFTFKQQNEVVGLSRYLELSTRYGVKP